MKILVTGAASGLGRNATEWLLAKGHQVIATGRDLRQGKELVQRGAEFHFIDLDYATPAEYLSLVKGCEAVWHCAAKSSPWGSESSFMVTNVQVTDRLAYAAGQAGVPRFVHISTPAIYFDFSHHTDIDEDFRVRRFANYYAKSKFIAEGHIQQRQQQFPQTHFTILRPRGLFGPHDRVIVPRVLQQIRQQKGVLRLPRGGDALLDLTFSLNVVEAMWLATIQEALPAGAAYNITNHQPQPLKVMLRQLLGEHLGIDFNIKNVAYPLLYSLAASMEMVARFNQKEPMLTRYSVAAVNFDMTLSQTRASSELKYQPVYSLDEGIALTAKAMQQNKRGFNG
ncbi:NAD-dependent epimerase/dehydratase family protein [Ewingella sp. S1.OA.A_B6]